MPWNELISNMLDIEQKKKISSVRSRFAETRHDIWTAEELDLVYGSGHLLKGSVDQQGGGSLALSADGIASIAKWLTNYNNGFIGIKCGFTVDPRKLIEIVIFWVGIGYCEEAILLVLLFKRSFLNIRLKIIGVEIHESVVQVAKNSIKQFGCDDCISIFQRDAMSVVFQDFYNLPLC
jgi:hypothetical protein